MKNKKVKPVLPLSNSRKRIFSIIAILLPFIFLILLEVILRVSGYGDNHSLFITHPDEGYENYYVVNPEIGKKYFNKMEYTSPAKDRFLKKKHEDVFRIFVLGSSSAVGFPYDHNFMFSRILNERLRDAYPGKKIEMVNTAITAINSFTLADFMPQILNEKPDAILIYAGHNEFYGAFGAGSNEAVYHSYTLIKMHLQLMNYRIYQLAINTIGKVTSIFNTSVKQRGTLMSRMVKDADIIYGSDTYKEGINNYEKNLSAMLEMAKEQNVTVFYSDLVSNLRDLKPFKSIPSDESMNANEHFNAARQFEQKGEFQKALENYRLARDYDCIRFRASSDINLIVKKLSDKYNAKHVSTNDLFSKNSPNGIVGDNLLTEHVHPNIAGYFLLSESFFNSIVESKVIAGSINEESAKSFKSFMASYGYSRLDTLIGVHRITNLKYHWPFRDETKDYIDYRKVYRPKGLIDSLAFNVMAKQQLSLSEAHEILAKRYFDSGDFLNAYIEYNSLTKINPYRSLYLRKTADCLLKLNDLPEALRYFERSTEEEDNFYAHFRAGEICMIKNDFEKAIVHFQKAQKDANEEEKEKTLIKIYQSLHYLNRADEGKEIAAYFKRVNPNRPLLIPPRGNNYMDYIPVQIKDKVDEAKKLKEAKDYDNAIKLLVETLDTKESPVTYRLLGDMYYFKKDYEMSHQYMMKAFPEFKFDTSFLSSLFMTNMALKRVDSAKLTLDQLKKSNPSFPAIAQFQWILNNPNSTKMNSNTSQIR
jgi:tetratricopeptide (TPR) repeat protein